MFGEYILPNTNILKEYCAEGTYHYDVPGKETHTKIIRGDRDDAKHLLYHVNLVLDCFVPLANAQAKSLITWAHSPVHIESLQQYESSFQKIFIMLNEIIQNRTLV